MTAVMIVATTVGIGYDYFMNGIWNSVNKGVRSSPSHDPTAAPPDDERATPLRPPPTLRIRGCPRARRNSGRTSRTTTRRRIRRKRGEWETLYNTGSGARARRIAPLYGSEHRCLPLPHALGRRATSCPRWREGSAAVRDAPS